MTKLLPLTLLCTVLTFSVLSAQSTAGKLTLSAAAGMVPTYHGKNAETNVIPVSFQVGYHVSHSFSLHGFVGYTAATTSPTTFYDGLTSQIGNKTTMMGLKTQVKRDFTESIELYGGMLLGYAMFSTTEYDTQTGEIVNRDPNAPSPYDPNAPKGQILYSGFVGMHYHMNHLVGVFAEVGYGISLLNTGISFSF